MDMIRMMNDGDYAAGVAHRQQGRITEESIVQKIFNSEEPWTVEQSLITFLRAARDIDMFKYRAQYILNELRASFFSHQDLTKSENRFGIFGTLPDDFVFDYVRNGFFSTDSQINRCLSGAKIPLFQSDLTEAYSSCPHISDDMQDNIDLYTTMKKHGITESCGIPLTSNGRTGMLRLMSTSDPAAFRESILTNLWLIQLIGNCIGAIGSRRFKSKFHSVRLISLTPQQVVLLRILQKDCTLNETAEILGISISTANQHIAAAKKALGTLTTHGTIVAAEKAGLLKF